MFPSYLYCPSCYNDNHYFCDYHPNYNIYHNSADFHDNYYSPSSSYGRKRLLCRRNRCRWN
jgi:hypothetical protein